MQVRDAELVLVGRSIRELRIAKGWKLVELAKRAGISASYLCEIEQGDKEPRRRIKQIARALEATPERLRVATCKHCGKLHRCSG